MGIDGIGGIGAINVSAQTKVQPKHVEATSVDVGTSVNQVQVESIKPVVAKSNSNNQEDGSRKEEPDRAGVQTDKEVSPEKIKAAVEDLNKKVKVKSPIHSTQLSFKYHDETNRISITVTDQDTQEVIREIPPEKALDMLAKAWEMAGLLVDEKR